MLHTRFKRETFTFSDWFLPGNPIQAMLATCSENDEQARRNPLAREIGCDGVGLSIGERLRRQGRHQLDEFRIGALDRHLR